MLAVTIGLFMFWPMGASLLLLGPADALFSQGKPDLPLSVCGGTATALQRAQAATRIVNVEIIFKEDCVHLLLL